MNIDRVHLHRRLLMLALAALPLSAQAQGAYPTKPIRLVVPFPPGATSA